MSSVLSPPPEPERLRERLRLERRAEVGVLEPPAASTVPAPRSWGLLRLVSPAEGFAEPPLRGATSPSLSSESLDTYALLAMRWLGRRWRVVCRGLSTPLPTLAPGIAAWPPSCACAFGSPRLPWARIGTHRAASESAASAVADGDSIAAVPPAVVSAAEVGDAMRFLRLVVRERNTAATSTRATSIAGLSTVWCS